MLELSVYLRCSLPLPPHLQSSFLELSENETLKAVDHGNKLLSSHRFWQKAAQRAMIMTKAWIQDLQLPKFHSCSCLRMNFGWVEMEDRKSWSPQILRLIQHPFRTVKVFWVESCTAYSEKSSFAHALPWQSSLAPVNFAMVHLRKTTFLRICSRAFYWKNWHFELWIKVRSCGASTAPSSTSFHPNGSFLTAVQEWNSESCKWLGFQLSWSSPFEQLSAQRAMIMTKARNPSHLQLPIFILGQLSENELWMGRCGGRGKEQHIIHTLSSIPSEFNYFHGSRAYSIYRNAHDLPWQSSLAPVNCAMVQRAQNYLDQNML